MYSFNQYRNNSNVRKLSRQQQQREYYKYKTMVMESANSILNPSAAAAGGTLAKDLQASASIHYRLVDGNFQYSVTNFDENFTTDLKTMQYNQDAVLDYSDTVQDGGFFFRIYSDTAALEYLLYIDVLGRATEANVDYSATVNEVTAGRHLVIHYQQAGQSVANIFDKNGLRTIRTTETFSNFHNWSYDSCYSQGLVFSTENGDVHSINLLRDGTETPVRLLDVDTTVYNYYVYMFDFGSNVTIRTTLDSLGGSTDHIRIYDATGALSLSYDARGLAKADYVVQAGNTKESIAASQSCPVQTLVDLNPDYDLNNLIPGETINGFSALNYSTVSFFDNGNFTMLLNTANLNGKGFLHILYYNSTKRTLDVQSHRKDYTYAFYEGTQRNWDSAYNYLAKSKLYVIYSNEYEYRSNEYEPDYSYNDLLYANSTYLLPIFADDEQLRQPILWATQSSFLPSGSDNEKWLSKGFHLTFEPRLGEDRIDMLVDDNRWGPGLFHFTDYSNTPNQIKDGGLDLWDNTGNRIAADGSQLSYTHTQQEKGYGVDNSQPVPQLYRMGLPKPYYRMNGTVSTDANLGASASYFTNLYPGMFVFSAKNTDFDQFRIYGETGHDSSGSTYSNRFQITSSASTVYQVYAKCLHEDTISRANDPSINHIILVNAATSSGITHSFSPDTNQDLDQLDGLKGRCTELHYILITQLCDERLTDAQIVEIATRFVNITDGKSTQAALTSLNQRYEYVTDVTDKSTVRYSMLSLDKDGGTTTKLLDIYKSETMYQASFGKDSMLIKATQSLEAFGKFGFNGLPDVSARSWSTFFKATNSEANVLGTDLLMWSISTDNYYKIQFTNWQTGFGADAFAYRRQLVTPTMDSPVIAFTHSAMSNTIDVIEPGVLELTRTAFGTLKNSAVQSYNFSSGPLGTLWNSTFSAALLLKSALIDDNNETDTFEFNENDGANAIKSNTFYHTDSIRLRTAYSNDSTNDQWATINEFYDDRINPTSYVSNEGYSESASILINNKSKTARIVYDSGISATFSYLIDPQSSYGFKSTEVNDEYAVFAYNDGSGVVVSYRDMSGRLVDHVKIEDTSFDNFRVEHSKNRYYVTYYDFDMNYEVLVFDGQRIEKVLSVPDSDENFESKMNDLL